MLEQLQPYILPILGVGQVLLAFSIIYLGQYFARKAAFEDLEKLVAELKDRVVAIEHDIEHLPDKDTANNLLLELAALNGKLEAYEERFDNFNKNSDRMQKQLDIIDHYLRKVEKS